MACLYDLGYAGQNPEGKFMLPCWDRVFTVYGEFLDLRSWDSGNEYLALSLVLNKMLC